MRLQSNFCRRVPVWTKNFKSRVMKVDHSGYRYEHSGVEDNAEDNSLWTDTGINCLLALFGGYGLSPFVILPRWRAASPAYCSCWTVQAALLQVRPHTQGLTNWLDHQCILAVQHQYFRCNFFHFKLCNITQANFNFNCTISIFPMWNAASSTVESVPCLYCIYCYFFVTCNIVRNTWCIRSTYSSETLQG